MFSPWQFERKEAFPIPTSPIAHKLFLRKRAERKRCEGLQKQVKKHKDTLLLYHLEESDDSEDERDLDTYLKRRIADYIDSKSVRDLVNEGKLEPQPIFQ